ncbi:MAG: GntR family transcriptional regulator [Gluconacetobacter diazotrophicus]|nr:GntR family transcriptional regulator [Gluconacetobacter diazotrophicus]
MRILEASAGFGHDGADGLAARSAAPERENLSQRAYTHISSRLIGGAMRPGEKLILRPLAARLGLSPTPVREALLRLVSEQALVLDDRGSAIVPVMTAEQFREMCDMRSDLEARAAERAAAAATAGEMDALQRLCDETVTLWNDGSYQEMLEANARFHRLICRIGRSPLIQRALEGLWIRLGPPYALALSRPVAPFARGEHPHQLMVAAFRDGNAAAAREAALRDVRESERVISGILHSA